METIVIGEWYAGLSDKEQNERYYELRDECIAKIGERPNGRPPYIIVKRDDTLFQRFDDYFNGGHEIFAKRLESSPPHPRGDVLCSKCGGMEFHLIYGEEDIQAMCVTCGTMETVGDL